MDRRVFLTGLGALAAPPDRVSTIEARPAASGRLDPDIADLQQRCFDGLFRATGRWHGLAPRRLPGGSVCSITATGLTLCAWPVGVENGWMTREQARRRALDAVRYLHGAGRGPNAPQIAGEGGLFRPFLDPDSSPSVGLRPPSAGATAVLIAGMLFVARYFDGRDPQESEIRDRTQALYARIEWDAGHVRPEHPAGRAEAPVVLDDGGEAVVGADLLAGLLACGSRTHPVTPSLWSRDRGSDPAGGRPEPAHSVARAFVDGRALPVPEGGRDPAGLRLRLDFEGGVQAVRAQRRYAVANPGGWDGYGADVWGLAACRGPGDFRRVIDAQQRRFLGDAVRGPGAHDDGTISPVAAMAAYPFAPGAVTNCLKAMKSRFADTVNTRFGLVSAFNPTLVEHEGRLASGRVVPGLGWTSSDGLAVDQALILVMIENARTGLIWERMRQEPNLRRGLRAAALADGAFAN